MGGQIAQFLTSLPVALQVPIMVVALVPVSGLVAYALDWVIDRATG